MSEQGGGGDRADTGKAGRLAEEKERRLAEALRANLHRRKAQSRARAEPQASLDSGTSQTKDGADSSS